MHDQHYICISVFYIGTVCGDRVVRNGNKLTEKLEKLNEVYSQVIASSNLLTKVSLLTKLFLFSKKFGHESLLFYKCNRSNPIK